MNKTITFQDAVAKVYAFDNGTEVTEYQVVISLNNQLLTYRQQLETLLDAFARVRTEVTKGAAIVFKRSAWGLNIIACGENPEAAFMIGDMM